MVGADVRFFLAYANPKRPEMGLRHGNHRLKLRVQLWGFLRITFENLCNDQEGR